MPDFMKMFTSEDILHSFTNCCGDSWYHRELYCKCFD